MSIRWNAYAYAGNNPVNYVDPDGRFFWFVLGAAVIGAVVAAGISLAQQTQELREEGKYDAGDILNTIFCDSSRRSRLLTDALWGALAGGLIGLGLGFGAASATAAVQAATVAGTQVAWGSAFVSSFGFSVGINAFLASSGYVTGSVIYNKITNRDTFEGISGQGIATNALWGGILGGVTKLVGANIGMQFTYPTPYSAPVVATLANGTLATIENVGPWYTKMVVYGGVGMFTSYAQHTLTDDDPWQDYSETAAAALGIGNAASGLSSFAGSTFFTYLLNTLITLIGNTGQK